MAVPTPTALTVAHKEAKDAGMDLQSFWLFSLGKPGYLVSMDPEDPAVSELLMTASADVPDSLDIRAALLRVCASMYKTKAPTYLAAARDACASFPSSSIFWLHLIRAVEACGRSASAVASQAERERAIATVASLGPTATLDDAVSVAAAQVGAEAMQQVFPSASSYVDIMVAVLRALLRTARPSASVGPSTSAHAAWVGHCFTFLDTYYGAWEDAFRRILDVWTAAVVGGRVDSSGLVDAARSLSTRSMTGRQAGHGSYSTTHTGQAGSDAGGGSWPLLALVQATSSCLLACVAGRDQAASNNIASAALFAICNANPADSLAASAMGQPLPDLVNALETSWLKSEVALGDADSSFSMYLACESARVTTRTLLVVFAESAAREAEVGRKGQGRKRGRLDGLTQAPGGHSPVEIASGIAPTPASEWTVASQSGDASGLHANHEDDADMADDRGALVGKSYAPSGIAGLLGSIAVSPAPAANLVGGTVSTTHPRGRAGTSAPTRVQAPRPKVVLDEAMYHPVAVFVNGLPFKTVVGSALRPVFARFGNVVEARVATTKDGKGKGFGIIVFDTAEARDMAMGADDVVIDSRAIRAEACRREIVERWLVESDPEVDAATRAASADAAAKKPVTMLVPHGVKRAKGPKVKLSLDSAMS